jgi:hypothetical protein
MTLSSLRIVRYVAAGLLVAACGCNSSVSALNTDGGNNLGVDAGGKIPIGSTQCSDGIDNDGDGKADYLDFECVGPNDNDEGTFATGIPGDNVDPCRQDCFFDGNSGGGDDKCLWQLKCDPRSVESECAYDPTYAMQHATECSVSASQGEDCVNRCQALVPNGCDCFGCCAIPGGPTIRLAATCTAADFGDPVKCPPCTQVTQCSNPCDTCEICIGKPSLPASCTPDGGTPPPPACGDYMPCGPGTNLDPAQCPANTGCITGCCRPLIIIG